MIRPTRVSTHFLSAEDAARIVARKGLAACIEGIARCLEQDYLRWGEFDKSARVANHSTDGVIELMPISDNETYTFKYVNGHPRNFKLGLPTVMAFGALAAVVYLAAIRIVNADAAIALISTVLGYVFGVAVPTRREQI